MGKLKEKGLNLGNPARYLVQLSHREKEENGLLARGHLEAGHVCVTQCTAMRWGRETKLAGSPSCVFCLNSLFSVLLSIIINIVNY